MAPPKLLVLTSLFPSAKRPTAGVFIRERMFRVGRELPVTVVSPVPWFPFQGLIRRWKPEYRPLPARIEVQSGVEVHFPRFLSCPGFFRSFDGFFMALASLPTLLRLSARFDIIDSHFAYPDGYCATLLGRWLRRPVTITLRGTEVPLSRFPGRRKRILRALAAASRVFSVSDSLKRHVVALGADDRKIRVVGNGVDTRNFHPVDQTHARARLNIPASAQVLVSVGALVERKGFHRVIEILPRLLERHPDLLYLIVGGGGAEGNIQAKLEQQVRDLNLTEHVRFLGSHAPDQLKFPLSAADVFVLATSNEGWANVFLEAMACGLPVVSTNVGGNREVINDSALGTLVPFGDRESLLEATSDALTRRWDRSAIVKYAQENSWDSRVAVLIEEFQALLARESAPKLSPTPDPGEG